MRAVSSRLLATALLVALAHAASAQTADEVIEKSIAAMGGRAALAKLKSRAVTGTITLVTPAGDITGTVEFLNASPNKSRSLLKADLTALGAGSFVLDQRFDGTSGYALDTLQGNHDITGNQLENMRNGSFPHAFLTYKAMGVGVKLEGKEKLGDRDVFVLAFEPPTGSVTRDYVDASTFLSVKTVATVDVPQLGRSVEQTSEFSDFRDVDGVKVAFTINASSPIQRYTITITTVEHNVPVDEALFAKPR